ncbi:MAG: hypothetical protein ACYDDO_09140 [Acidiferrobacterales bacterium]
MRSRKTSCHCPRQGYGDRALYSATAAFNGGISCLGLASIVQGIQEALDCVAAEVRDTRLRGRLIEPVQIADEEATIETR